MVLLVGGTDTLGEDRGGAVTTTTLFESRRPEPLNDQRRRRAENRGGKDKTRHSGRDHQDAERQQVKVEGVDMEIRRHHIQNPQDPRWCR